MCLAPSPTVSMESRVAAAVLLLVLAFVSRTSSAAPSLPPLRDGRPGVQVPFPPSVDMDVGDDLTCAIDSQGTLRCAWLVGLSGQAEIDMATVEEEGDGVEVAVGSGVV